MFVLFSIPLFSVVVNVWKLFRPVPLCCEAAVFLPEYCKTNLFFTAAGFAIKTEDVALFTPADVGLWNADTVMLTAMVPQVTAVYF